MNPKIIEFNGNKFRLHGKYYRKNCWSKKGSSNLHRAIWEYHNGIIPLGFDIHHIDGDSFNNDITNLECVNRKIHRSQHAKENIKLGILKPPSKQALKKAAEWHASEEGIKWHQINGKAAWENREWHECSCHECNKNFMSPYPNRAKFCHQNCKAMALRRRRGKNVGVRPNRKKEITLSGKRAVNKD
jgi:hypothetical protein